MCTRPRASQLLASLPSPMATPTPPVQTESPSVRTPLNRITSFFVYLFERITPDPYIFAVTLIIIIPLLAALLAPKGSLQEILNGWYASLFQILAFASRMSDAEPSPTIWNMPGS